VLQLVEVSNVRRPPIEFRVSAILYTLLGIVVALTIHFVVLSSERLNWLSAPGAIIDLVPTWLF
jgi:hypothetical protein